jgi:hypothetical protein
MANIKCFLLEKTDKWKKMNDVCSVPIYKRVDTGEEMTIRDAPAGAIWENDYWNEYPMLCGLDGKSYSVKTPAGDWIIDGPANNCSRPDDRVHKCWCRHGEAPNFTVNKNGNTCSAGGGSILIGNYHAFLLNGILTEC